MHRILPRKEVIQPNVPVRLPWPAKELDRYLTWRPKTQRPARNFAEFQFKVHEGLLSRGQKPARMALHVIHRTQHTSTTRWAQSHIAHLIELSLDELCLYSEPVKEFSQRRMQRCV